MELWLFFLQERTQNDRVLHLSLYFPLRRIAPEVLFFDALCLKQLKSLMNQTALLSHLHPPEDGESTRTVIYQTSQ